MSLVDEQKDAQLECEVDANPISKVVISWKRRKAVTSDLDSLINPTNPSFMMTTTTIGTTVTIFNGSSSELLLNNNRFSERMERNRSILTIKNASKDDSGSYECLAFNGIGYEDSATANLVVKRKIPLFVSMPSYHCYTINNFLVIQ